MTYYNSWVLCLVETLYLPNLSVKVSHVCGMTPSGLGTRRAVAARDIEYSAFLGPSGASTPRRDITAVHSRRDLKIGSCIDWLYRCSLFTVNFSLYLNEY